MTAAGTVAGSMIGSRAQKVVAEGGQIEGIHRPAVIGGAVMADGTLGALAAIPLIGSGGEGTPLGSDEQTVAVLVLAEGALGTLLVLTYRHELGSRNLTLAPARSGNTKYGLLVLLRW